MKALVTGGTGFIGSKVVDLLVENGHTVRLFARKDTLPVQLAGKEVSVFRGDLQDAGSVVNAMAGMDVFYHIGEVRNISPLAAKKNVQLVEKILGHIDKSGIKRFIFISSLTVAGIPSTIPASEETKPKLVPEEHYTAYKKQCEEILASQTAVEYVIIRPGVVYGSGSRYLGSLVAAVARFGPLGFPFIGKGNNVAPLIHVKDLSQAIYLAGVRREAAGQTFNITDGLTHSWYDFFKTIAVSLGKKFKLLSVPTIVLSAPSKIIDFFGDFFHMKF
ncbi:MAG TPA: NAD-dependent epimerase/dehydratase family protein, partial [Nitrospirota bacterium]|nr:NAD-dependent epimerase/dehydratase family protein [Nitrospirota bacterium]